MTAQVVFTTDEFAVWEKVREAATLYLALTESDPQHPMEREEICHAFHDIQARLALRPTMRALTGVDSPYEGRQE